MTFKQFLLILRARKRAALISLGTVLGLTLALSFLLPARYTALSSVVIDVKPDPLTVAGFDSMILPSFMSTQADILISERVALRVIRDLKLTENADIRSQWMDDTDGEGTIEQYLVTLLQKHLDIKPSRDSNVIAILYKAPDARFAAGLANAFAEAYIATTLELRVDPAKQFTTFFNTQIKDARDQLEAAQGKVSAFQRDKGIIAADERIDVETSRLNDLSTQLVQIQAIASESISRQAQAQGTYGDRMQEVLNNPVVGAMKADIARSEARLKELLSKYGDKHPQVIEAKASLAEMTARVDAETRRVTGGVGVTNTINRQREAQLRQELDLQRGRVLQMKAVRDQGLALQRDVDNAQRIYDSLIARMSQTKLEAQTTQSYAKVLTVAQPPIEPSFPRLIINIPVAIILGSFLAVAVVLLKELRDRRIRSVEDVVAVLGLPVLGTLPKPNAKRFLAGKRALPLTTRPIRLAGPDTSTFGV